MTDMQTSLSFLIVRSSILNPVIYLSTHLWIVKWPIYKYIFASHIPFHLLYGWCQISTNLHHKWYDPLHIIVWPYWFIDLDITCPSLLPLSIGAKSSLKLLRHLWCITLKPPTFPSHLQLVHRHQALSWSSPSSHMTPCQVSYAMTSFITCVSIATYPSHFHLHGIGCSH
jgi:hypothetical protein